MFKRILHANDGSAHAFRALDLAIGLAKLHGAELHMICVEEISYLPDYIEEIREETGMAARLFHKVVGQARARAEQRQVKLHSHVLTGHPVRTITNLASELGADLLVIGAAGHSPLYERMIGSRADRLVHLAPCPVLVVK